MFGVYQIKACVQVQTNYELQRTLMVVKVYF